MTTIDQLYAFKIPTLICAECGSPMALSFPEDHHCTIAVCHAWHCKQRGKRGKVANERVELIATDESTEFMGRTIEQPRRSIDPGIIAEWESPKLPPGET